MKANLADGARKTVGTSRSLQIPIYQIGAFSDEPFMGNPASVCLLERWLPDTTLQAIALENNHPETAFLVDNGQGYDLRWFTPACEVTLCGHATLAAAHAVREFLRPGIDAVTFQSPSGPLHVAASGDRWTLDLPALPHAPIAPPPGIAEALGVTPQACFASLDLMVVLRDEAELKAIRPDLETIATFDLRGMVVTAPAEDCDFASRFFAPKLSIPEDAITGSAHCTLIPYWAKRLGKTELAAKQFSIRLGGMHVIRMAGALRGPRVHLHGSATTYLEGRISIPDPA